MNASVTCYSYVPTKWNLLKHLFPTPEKKFIGRHFFSLRSDVLKIIESCIFYVSKKIHLPTHAFLTSRNVEIYRNMCFLRPKKTSLTNTCLSYDSTNWNLSEHVTPTSRKNFINRHAIPASRHFEIRRNMYFLSPEKNH